MREARRAPRLFIGSSVEKLPVARTLQEALEYDCEATVWTQDIFRPSRYALTELLEATKAQDFAAFIVAADDVVTTRGKQYAVARDNVIFETGLFIGAKGPENCFLLAPRRSADLHLPSDLMGVMPITYQDDRSDGNFLAALGPAANRISRVINGRFAEPEKLERYMAEWNGPTLAVIRERLRRGANLDAYDPTSEEDRDGIRQVFAFLESLASAVLSGQIDELAARASFEQPMRAAWPWIATALAPPNHVQDYWRPPPSLAVLLDRWQ